MQTNVFLRSTRRQPVRTAFLALVLALVSFTFVGRGSEYLLISQEVDRLGSWYRTIGTVEPRTRGRSAQTVTDEAAELLAQSGVVDLVERRQYVSALIEDGFCNADTDLDTIYGSQNIYFYGILDAAAANLIFTVDQVVTGLPEYITPGPRITLNGSQAVIEELGGELEVGGRYLVRAEARALNREQTIFEIQKLVPGGKLWYWSVPEGEADFSDPALEGLGEEIGRVRDNQRALSAIPVTDMLSLPEVRSENPSIYLAGGRWLTEEDNTAGNRVCVLHAGLADARGLAVGDSVTLNLRDVEASFGCTKKPVDYDTAQTVRETYEIVGLYDFQFKFPYTCVRNQFYVPASTVPETFENGMGATGTQRWINSVISSSSGGSIPVAGDVNFVLTSPEEAGRFLTYTAPALEALGCRVELLPNNYRSFRDTAGPMERSSLYNFGNYAGILLVTFLLGVFLYFRSRGKELAIVRAMGLPIKRCVRESALPMALIGALAVPLGGALGWMSTLRSASETLEALEEFAVEGIPQARLSPLWLAPLAAGALLLLTAMVLTAARILAERPVLEQLQGGAQVRLKKRSRQALPETPPPDAAGLSLEAVRAVREAIPPERSLGRRAAVAWRFVRRQILRAPVKSALAALTAGAFAIGLGAIHLAIVSGEREIDHLYTTTRVAMEITAKDSTDLGEDGGFLYRSTVDAVMDTGYLEDCYLEGASSGVLIPNADALNIVEVDGARFIGADQMNAGLRFLFRSTSDGEVFFSEAGTGGNYTVRYADGWDQSLFSKDWAAENEGKDILDSVIPIVVPAKYTEGGEDAGPPITPGQRVLVLFRGRLQLCEVAGVYSRGAASKAGDTVLLPTSALEAAAGRRVVYSKVRFTVDPGQNRDLEGFRLEMDELVNSTRLGGVASSVLLWDEELTEAVEPLEGSLELMRVLYPVVLALSLLTAAGTAVLFVMISAKDAATLRVLGTPRGRTQVILVLQQAVTCFAGLAIGVIGVLLYIHQARPELLEALAGAVLWRAAAYLGAAVLGAAASSAAVTGKNPLEMLQVKE